MNLEVSIPLWLFISQWILLLALGFLVIIAYRQFGYQLGLRDGGSERDGLKVGDIAPSFEYISVKLKGFGTWQVDPQNGWSIFLFVEPKCLGCQNAIITFENLNRQLKVPARVLVVMSDQKTNVDSIEGFKTTSLDLVRVNEEVMTKLYHTQSVPFLYLIDPNGKIRSRGTIGDTSSLKRLLSILIKNEVKIELEIPEKVGSDYN